MMQKYLRAGRWLALMLVLIPACVAVERPPERVVDRLQREARGLYLLWAGNRSDADQLLTLPFIRGGQVAIEWAAIEPAPGRYNFEALDAKIERFARLGVWCTLQIDGNRKPAWLFDQVPFTSERPHHQVQDAKGTLMFWHPRFQAAHEQMLRAVGEHLAHSPHLKRLLGVRLNFNAVGTEQFIVPAKLRNPAAWTYPRDVSREGLPMYDESVQAAYIDRVVTVYEAVFSPHMLVFVRNQIDGDVLARLDPSLRSGKLALFHTSSEVEPRVVGMERRYGLFYDYARSGQTAAYAEPWASAWGEHGGVRDVRWCSPCQWNYWTLLFNLHCGVSFIGEYYTNFHFASTGEHPSGKVQTEHAKQQAGEFLDAYTWTAEYVGLHHRPAEAPGAWVAFRSNAEIKAKNDPKAPASTWQLSRFTDDYTFLLRRLPGDHSEGVGPVGPTDQRFGAFARRFPSGDVVRLAPDAAFLGSLRHGTVRVTYLDTEQAGQDDALEVTWVTSSGRRVLGRTSCRGTGRWAQWDLPLPLSEGGSAVDAGEIEIRIGTAPLVLHMVEIRRGG